MIHRKYTHQDLLLAYNIGFKKQPIKILAHELDIESEIIEEQIKISQLSVDSLIDKICEHFMITRDNFTGKIRKYEYAKARQIFCYIARYTLNYGVVQISKITKKNHTSVTYSCIQIQNLLDTGDKETVNAYFKILESFRNEE